MTFWCIKFIRFWMSVLGLLRSCNFEIEWALCMVPHALTYVDLNSCWGGGYGGGSYKCLSLVYLSFIGDCVSEIFYNVCRVDFIKFLILVLEMHMSCNSEIDRALYKAPHTLTYADLNSCWGGGYGGGSCGCLSLVYLSIIEDSICEIFNCICCMDFIKSLMLVLEMRMSSHFEIEQALCMAPHTQTYVDLKRKLWWRELRMLVIGLISI